MEHNSSHHQHQQNILPDSRHHNLHWNYATPSATMSTPLTSTPIQSNTSLINNNTWTPPSTRSMKRAMSESDCDDIYSEESSKEHPSSIENDSCQLMSRKKRRGVIEKKRRDRINTSLTELKRLVPSAFEKQGSAKLEKAEILQLTVDHLKSLHSKGFDSVGFDPQRFAMDYHIIGFRECASEVARYLVTIEGMDIQDPMRLRLMSHLQCFAAQRELSVKSSVNSSSNWSHIQTSYQPNYASQGYQGYPATSPAVAGQQNQANSQNTFNASFAPGSSTTYLNSTGTSHSPEYSTSGYGTANNTSSSSNTASTTSPSVEQNSTSEQQQNGSQPIYTDLSNSHDRLNLGETHYNSYANPNQLYAIPSNGSYAAGNINNNSKPYRPWHPEMAY